MDEYTFMQNQLFNEKLNEERLIETVRHRFVIAISDTNRAEKQAVLNILNHLDYREAVVLNKMFDSGKNINGLLAQYEFMEAVKAHQNEEQKKQKGYSTELPENRSYMEGAFGGYVKMNEKVAEKLTKIDAKLRTPINRLKELKIFSHTDDYTAELLSSEKYANKSVYAIARDMPKEKLAAITEQLGVKKVAGMIKYGSMELLQQKGGDLKKYFNLQDDSKIINIIRQRHVVTSLEDAKSIKRFLNVSKNISRTVTAINAVLSYANLIDAPENADKARIAVGDTGNFIGSYVGAEDGLSWEYVP